MKRSLLNIAMAAFISCFAACSEEEIIATQDGTPQEVTVMAQVPTRATTRNVGVDNVIEDNQLRCILSVIDNTDNSEIDRIEKLVGADADKISFIFTVGSDIEYSCLFWADYVDKSASKTTDEKYPDKYYNTANLQAISVKVDADAPANNAKLFNNAAADAFYGVLPKAQIADAGTPSITLKRPFAKLNLKPEAGDEWASQITTMDIEFNMPGEFNMLTGKAAGSKTSVKATGVSKTENAYFSTFMFIEDPATAKFNDDIKISFVKPGSETSETVTRTIKIGFIKPNNEINGEANLSKEQDITVDVNINGKPEEPEDPNAPKVGQYLYADGTWGDTYNADGNQKSIGIIFADAKGKTDNSEYGKSNMKIYGYAMALTNVGRRSINQDNDHKTTIEPTVTAPWDKNDYNGYKYTQSVISDLTTYTNSGNTSALYTAYNTWLTANAINNDVNNLSSWYIPSSAQLTTIVGLAVDDSRTDQTTIVIPTKNTTFATAYANGELFAKENTKGVCNIMSSSIIGGNTEGIQTGIVEDNDDAETIKIVRTYGVSNGTFNIRPVITIFKVQN